MVGAMKNLRSSDFPNSPTQHHFSSKTEHSRTSYDPFESHNPPISSQNLTLAEIQEVSKHYLLSGNFEDYLRLLTSASQKDLDRFPIVRLYKATAMLFSEYPRQQIEEELLRIEKSNFNNHLKGEIIAIRALIQSYTGVPEIGIRLSQKALPLIAPQHTFFRNLIERDLGIAFTLKCDLRNANFWLEKLLMSSLELRDWGSVLAAYNYLTFVRKNQGRLRDAAIIYKKALEFIEIHSLEMTPHGIKILAGYAHLLLMWHCIEEAKVYCQKAIRYAKQTDILYGHTAYQHLSEAFILENAIPNAEETIQEIQQLSFGRDNLYHQIHLKHMQAVEARIHVESGRFEKAYAWLVSSGFDRVPPELLHTRYGYELGYILPIATRVYIAKGMVDRAIHLINTTIPQFLHQGAVSFLTRALVSLSAAYHAQGEMKKAIESLMKAVELGAPEDNTGDFIVVGHNLMPLLYDMKKSRLDTDFSNKILSILSSNKPNDHTPRARIKGISPLTRREFDVLELIAKGLTNREIGHSLFLSANTIKSHSINIYRKLDVSNRNQAVSKARILGILPTKKPTQGLDLRSFHH